MMKHYVIWVGYKKGVFDSWEECKKNIEGFSGARYKKFSNKKQADKAYKEGYKKHWGVKGKFMSKSDDLFKLPKGTNYKYLIKNSIVVDGACENATTGNMEFQGLDMNTGEYIFQSKVYKGGTNNIAEFLALYEAIKYAKENSFKGVIFSDSKIAISWIKRVVCNTDYTKLKNPELIDYIKEALGYLQNNEVYDKIYRWDTRNWGENPADYGRK